MGPLLIYLLKTVILPLRYRVRFVCTLNSLPLVCFHQLFNCPCPTESFFPLSLMCTYILLEKELFKDEIWNYLCLTEFLILIHVVLLSKAPFKSSLKNNYVKILNYPNNYKEKLCFLLLNVSTTIGLFL